jgi:ribosomal protein S18 acetylase RimI-like enzyme
VEVAIRAASLGDTAEVLSVWQTADIAPSTTDDPLGIERLLERDPGALLVAIVDKRIVGTLIAAFDGWRGSMYRLAVLPLLRQHGVGGALVAAGERRLLDLGARRLSALIINENLEAVSLWEMCGYTQDPRMGRWIKTV